MSRTYISDLSPNQFVEGIYAIQNCQMGLTKNQKPFLKCLLADRTGRLPGRMWNASEELIQSLPTNGFVEIEGQTQPYQGELQIILQNIRSVQPGPQDLLDLLPCTQRNIDAMFNQLRGILNSMNSPSLKALAGAYLADEAFMAKFRQAPAAMQLHHAYLGGLLEHTLSLMVLAEAVLPLYPEVRRDIVLMGLFVHDLGKCEELTWETGFGYSDDGQLVGHIARGLVWLNDKARQCAADGQPVPVEALRVLEHILLSHHGLPEYGALKIPATPEAVFVHQLDNLDAKMQMVLEAAQTGGTDQLGGNFTEKNWALGTRVYRVDPLASEAHLPASKPAPAPAAESRAASAPAAALNIGQGSKGKKADPNVRGGLF